MDRRLRVDGTGVLTSALLICFALGELPAGEAAAPAGAAPFRRVVFEQTIPLQKEAPGVAAEGHWAAFIAPPTLHLVDLRTGTVAIQHDLQALGLTADSDATVLGFTGGRLIIQLLREPDRPKPDSGIGRINYGPARGQYEILAVKLPDANVKPGQGAVQVDRLFALPATAAIAPELLDGRLVFTLDSDLHIRPLDNGAEQVLPLKDKPVHRPRAKGGGVLGRTMRGVYVLRPGAGGLSQVPCAGTVLAPLESLPFPEVDWCDDLLLVGASEGLVAADLDGQERWRVALPFLRACGGDRQVICARLRHLLLGLSRRDGRVLWRADAGHYAEYRALLVADRYLVILGEEMLSVYDAGSGACLVNMARAGKLVRRVSYGGDVHLKTALSGRVLVLGYETWVLGVDLTPTAEVPKEAQSSDPANACGKAAEWLEAHSSRQAGTAGGRAPALAGQWELSRFARNLADTPAVLPGFQEAVQALLEGQAGSEKNMLYALGWYPNALVPRAVVRCLRAGRLHPYEEESLVLTVAAHPELETRRACLQQLTTASPPFPVYVRDYAARCLRLEGQDAWLPAEDRQLLYGLDQAAAVAEFTRRLSVADPARRAAALSLVRQAADAVVVALAEKLKALPDAKERASGEEMVKQARARLDLIAKTPAALSP